MHPAECSAECSADAPGGVLGGAPGGGGTAGRPEAGGDAAVPATGADPPPLTVGAAAVGRRRSIITAPIAPINSPTSAAPTTTAGDVPLSSSEEVVSARSLSSSVVAGRGIGSLSVVCGVSP